ncbi:MAG: BTAD domain-containing putative transcriptional regulator [Gemmatimonadota bacterium]
MNELRVLGTVDLRDERETTLGEVLAQPKRLALLAYLAVARPRGHQRIDPVLALFWPELDTTHARAALRQSVYFLRRHLGAETVVSRGRGEELAVAPDTWCDAVAFEQALDDERPEDALELYRGPLLDGFHVTGAAEEFEHWVDAERERLELRAVRAARDLSDRAEEGGDRTGAVQWARRALALRPLDEGSMRRLMRLLDGSGDRAGALHAYEEFAALLEANLGVEPSAESQRLAAAIRGRRPSAEIGHAAGAGSDPGATDRASDAEPTTVSTGRPSPGPDAEPLQSRSGWRIGWRVVAGLAALALLVVLVWAVRRDGAEPVASTAPTLAVLPFDIHGADPAWREGMVDLLTTRLDGVSDLRAINSRTVLARWHERVDPALSPDLEDMLAVGRATGARYSLVGSAVRVGSALRLTAEIYETGTGASVGRGMVQGSPDSVLSLVDDLSLELVQAIFRDTDPRIPFDLASITTSSIAALKAYLNGEARFRRSDFDGAIRAYQQAIAADSSFALAHHRLALSYGYVAGSLSDIPARQSELAARYMDRLPEREALLVRTSRAFEQGSREAFDLAHRAVDLYPDDPEAWYLLGDITYHLGAPALVSHVTGDRALSRAVELDSLFLPAYIHLIHNAFVLHADSALAARRMEAFARRRGESEQQELNALAFDIAFGSPAARSEALAAVARLTPRSARHIALNYLWHPLFLAQQREVLMTVRAMPGSRGTLETLFLYFNALSTGRLSDALGHLSDERMDDYRAGASYLGWAAGLPIPVPVLERALGAGAEDTTAVDVFFAGAWAVDRERWPDYEAAVRRLGRLSERAVVEGDPVASRFWAGAARGLEGYAAWRRGDRESAAEELSAARANAMGRAPDRWMVNTTLRLWLGRLAYERGRPLEAGVYFRSLYEDDLVSNLGALHLAVALEAQDDAGAAQTLRSLFQQAWRESDRELRDWALPGFVPPALAAGSMGSKMSASLRDEASRRP